MLDKLQSYGWYGSTYCAIECSTVEGATQFFGVTAKKQKGEYTAIEEFQFSEIETISDFVSKNQHCHLIVNTNQVLIKETVLRDNEADMIAEAFPGLAVQDFFIDVYTTATQCFVAICRKEIVQELVKGLQIEKIEVLTTRLGFGALQPLLPYFENKTIATSNYALTTQESAIVSFTKENNYGTQYTIEDIEISSSHLLALSGLFLYGASGKGESELQIHNDTLTSLQHQKIFFRKGVYVAIGVLAAILMINTLLFTNYYSKYQNLKAITAASTSQKENYKKVQEQVEKKERMVTNILQSGSSKSSFYINRLVVSQPATVQLLVIDYQPLERSVQAKKPIVYTSQALLVEGKSNDKIGFNNWIAALEQQDWITNVTLTQYAQSSNDHATFEIRIRLEADATKN